MPWPADILPDRRAGLASWLAEPKRLLIDGEWVDGGSGVLGDSVNPATGAVAARFQVATAADVDRAVAAARAAFREGAWRTMGRRERGRRLLSLADLCRVHQAELATLEAIDTGKTYGEAFADDLPEAIEFFEYYAGWTNKFHGETIPVEGKSLNFTLREPVGVCGLIVPWNFPLLLAVWKLGPALAMGNTVVIKPAEATPLATVRFLELAHEAGILPSGVVNLVMGGGDVGRMLSRHPGIDKVSFTGSTATGRDVVHGAADSNLKTVTLELGGKSANIIFADAPDLDAACTRSAEMIFSHKGEKCSEPTRLFVEQPLYERVVDRVAAHAERLVCGDPFEPRTDQGPQCTREHMERILRFIESGKNEGARLVAGGGRDTSGGNARGFFIRPTVFADVAPHMTIFGEEIFGPVLTVTPFDSEQEAIDLANATTYGLAAGLWTRDIDRGIRMARALEAGTVFVNRYGCYDAASPFGGYKQSGWGREKGIHSLEAYTRLKSVWIAHPAE